MAPVDVLVIGESLFDVVVDADLGMTAHAGGGPYNVARAIGRLDGAVAFLGGISDDRFGRALRTLLHDDGVDLRCLADRPEPTTLAMVELSEGGDASYHFHLAGTAAIEVGPEDARALVPEGVGAVVVGTLGLLAEPLAVATEAVLEELAPTVVRFVDPNVRPVAVTDEATYRARLQRVLAAADVVKVSDDDLAWLLPDAAPEDGAARLLDQGARLVLLTRGAEGVTIVSALGSTTVEAAPVDVGDTIGAGGAFLGAWVAEWRVAGRGREELADREAVREVTLFACRAAALACSRPGADPPRRDEL